jgi:hypothetical protein
MEPKCEKMGCKPFKPGTRGLFKPIQSFLEFTYMMRQSGINEARRLLHVYGFLKKAMEEGV